jgi:hypothetical protein
VFGRGGESESNDILISVTTTSEKKENYKNINTNKTNKNITKKIILQSVFFHYQEYSQLHVEVIHHPQQNAMSVFPFAYPEYQSKQHQNEQ